MPTSSRPWNPSASASSHPGSASASLFSSATNSLSETANPWLLAAQNPRLQELRTNCTRNAFSFENSASTISAEPSPDPLSTTITSNGARVRCAASESKHARKRSRRFQFTTTTEMLPLRYLPNWCIIPIADVDMDSIGEMLRRARNQRGMSLDEVAARTRINRKYLDAIETGDRSSIPGGFFFKSFVRQYAAALAADDPDFLQDVEETLAAEQPATPPAQADDEVLKALAALPVTERSTSMSANAPVTTYVILLVLVLIGCTGLYMWWHRAQQAEASVRMQRQQQTQTSVPPVPAQTTAKAPTPQSVEPAAAPPVAAKPAPSAVEPISPAPAPVPATGPITLEITATD